MRIPVGPSSSAQGMTSLAVAVTAEVWEQQAELDATDPRGRLQLVGGTFTDDAGRMVQRGASLELAAAPDWLEAGMWVRLTLGVQNVNPVIYRLPMLMITDITRNLDNMGGAGIEAGDPATVLNGNPFQHDESLWGTLRDLVGEACAESLSRVVDATGVPALPVPAGSVAEFGQGRWDVAVRVADALGVALRFNDRGDPVGRMRNGPAPSPSASIQRALLPGGSSHRGRYPSSVVVALSRGSDATTLYGHANHPSPPPWYLPNVIVDRVDRDAAATQADADQLAQDLFTARMGDLDTYDSLPILPAPWLEAGVDVVTFKDATDAYWVRALTLSLPSLATAVTLRRAT